MHGLDIRRLAAAAMVASCAVACAPAFAQAQSCKADDLFAVVDRTGQRLREINAAGQPRLRGKLQELAKKNGWADTEVESKGQAAIEDDVIRGMDTRAAELLTDIDRLADVQPDDDAICKRLEEARTKSSQLIEVAQQRSTHALARIDLALKPPLAPAASAVAATPAPSAPAAAQTTAAETPSRPAPVPAPPRPKVAAAASPAWDTKTVDARTVRDVAPAPAVMEAMPPPPDPGALGYSPDEINAAGRGVFGSISAGLASVIDHAFQKFGRPTGYILGDEGGGAFFAGLRYGQGRLVTKTQGERRVYWQGPSAGFDFGVAGSQVMFLVYSIDDHDQLYQRFTGVDGSAYLVGGVGITFMKRGKVILAPIRTGLGFRVGANLGYLKFTSSPSLNPF